MLIAKVFREFRSSNKFVELNFFMDTLILKLCLCSTGLVHYQQLIYIDLQLNNWHFIRPE